jgi:pentatricopeptide repeat protein
MNAFLNTNGAVVAAFLLGALATIVVLAVIGWREEAQSADPDLAPPERPFAEVLEASIHSLFKEREEINEALRLLQHIKQHGCVPDPDPGTWPTIEGDHGAPKGS